MAEAARRSALLFRRSSPALRTTPQHLRHTDVRHLFGDEFFQYTFTVVRDPYSRIESEYQFRRDLSGRLRRPPLPEFSLWLELQLKRAGEFEWHLDNHLRPQVDFLGSGVEVFRFEDGIGRAIRSVSAATGLPVPASIPHARARSAGAEKLHWDLHDRLLVNRFYAEDFERLEYEMVK